MTGIVLYSQGSQNADKAFADNRFADIKIQGKNVVLDLTADQLGILRNFGIHFSQAKAPATNLYRESKERVEMSTSDLGNAISQLTTTYRDTTTTYFTGGKDTRFLLRGTIPVVPNLDLTFKAGSSSLSIQ